MTDELVTVVEPDGAGALQPSHPGHQIGVGGLDDEMVMIAHQAEGMDLPTRPLASLGQRLEEIVAIHVVG